MKIKELDANSDLTGVRFVYENCVYIFKSAWAEGIWAKKEGDENPDRVLPLFITPEAFLELQLAEGDGE